MEAHEDLESGGLGIGGWLILFAVSRVIAVFLWGLALLATSTVLFNPRIWMALTTPGTPAYHPLWSVAIIYEVTGNTLFFLLSLLLLGLFFARRKIFRPVMVTYMVATVFFLWGDYFISGRIPAVRLHGSDIIMQGGIQTTISALIWVPYFLFSERVKKTFVK